MSITFNASSTKITIAPGNLVGLDGGPMSIIAIVRLTDTSSGSLIFGSSGTGNALDFEVSGGSYFCQANGNSLMTASTSDNWHLAGYSKANGTSTPVAHKYVYGTGTWTHANGSGTVPDGTAVGSGDTIQFGQFSTNSEWLGADLAVLAVFDYALTNDQVEPLAYSLDAWYAAAPRGGWVFDHQATGMSLLDFTGGGANQTASQNTAIGTTSLPVFSYGFRVPILRHSVASGQSAAVGTASETDTVPALIEPKIFKANETDTAQTLGRLSTTAITLASETDTAQTLGRLSTTALVKATETDTAQILGRLSTTAISQALETDTAQTLGRLSTTAITLASEVDTAQTIGRVSTTAIGFATEVDTAQPLGRVSTKLIGIAVETDSSLVITPVSSGTLGPALEVDTARALIAGEAKALGTAFEVDSAQSFAESKTKLIGIATQLNTALAITAVLTGHQIDTAFETDLALGIPSPAPGGVDIMRLFDSSVIFDTASVLVTGIGIALVNTTDGTPERILVTPGAEIAWDDCTCGQLAAVIPRRYPSNNFPAEAVVIRNCDNAIVAAQIILGLMRCAPMPDDNGNSPLPSDLTEAARKQEQDAFVVRATAQCILESLQRTNDVAAFTINGHNSVGPSGGCYGTELNLTVGFYVNCGC